MASGRQLVTGGNVVADRAIRTPQFWLLWLVVGLPLAWGIMETLKKSLALFR